MDLQQAVIEARTGDKAGLERLLELTRPTAVGWATGLVRDRATAEDVAQDAMLEVWRTLDHLREPAAYLGWVRLIVRKHADRHRRRRQPVLVLDQLLDLPSEAAGPGDVVAGRDEGERVRQTLALVSASDRRLLELRYRSDWTDADLAELLGITPGAVRKRLHDARRRLRPRLAAALDLTDHDRRTDVSLPIRINDVTDGLLAESTPVLDATPLSTGVRAIDGLLPWPRAGRIELQAPVRVGAMVLLGEVLTGLLAQGPAAIVGVSRPFSDDDETTQVLTLLVEDPDGQPEHSHVFRGAGEAALAAGVAEAGNLAREGSTVLLVVDRGVADVVGLPRLGRLPLALAHGTVTVVLLSLWADAAPTPWEDADTRVVLSRALAAQGVYPAIDLLASSSGLADAGLASEVRRRLGAAQELHDWVAQPFMTTAAYTGTPGERVSAHTATTQLRALLA